MLTMMLSVMVNAQTSPTEVSTDGTIRNEAYAYVFGTTSDTLTNADTVTYVFRVKGSQLPDINIKAYSDHVSGTAGGYLILSHSIDGINYESSVGDTITLTGITGDALDSEVINKSKYLYPYLKLTWEQSGTAVTVPKAYIYTKLN